MPFEDILGVVLAGGESRRMGRDKARIELGGSPGDPVREHRLGVTLAEHAARRLEKVCAAVVVADGGRESAPGRTSIEDGPGTGPAAGLLGAAAFRPEAELLVLACDLPQVPVELLEAVALRDPRLHGEARVPRWSRGVEPLCALYRPSALKRLAQRVEAGRLALHRWLDDLDAEYLEVDRIARFGPPEELFLNLNRPEDLRRLSAVRLRSSAGLDRELRDAVR